MAFHVWQKSWSLLITALAVSLATFLIIQVLPADPALLVLGAETSPEAYSHLRKELGLERPAWERFGRWLLAFGRGDWGNSLRYNMPVRELLAGAFPLSLLLAILAIGLAVVLAIPGGIFIAARPQNRLAKLLALASQVGMAIPQFWLGILCIQIFAVQWRLLPPGGLAGWQGYLLPALTLALPRAAILTRQVQLGVGEALTEDYIRTARGKGLSERAVVYKHALANGAISVYTIAAVQFAQLLAGTIIVEQVFSLPGVGQLLLAGVLQRDLPLVQAAVTVVAVLIILLNFLVDIGLAFLDPRLRYE